MRASSSSGTPKSEANTEGPITMKKHIRETTLLIETRGKTNRLPKQFLVDCSCGKEYYVKLVDGLTEFESLEQGRREHVATVERGAFYNLLYLAKGLEVQDPQKVGQGVIGAINLKGAAWTIRDAFVQLFDRIERMESDHAQAVENWTRNDEQVLAENERLARQVELLQAELANVRESSAVVKKQLEAQVHASPTPQPSSGILDPLTRLIMVAEELDADHEYWAVGCADPTSLEHRLDEKAKVLREVYGDLKPILDTISPHSAYPGDRVRATWEVWEDGTFIDRASRIGVVTAARVPGKNFIDFVADDGSVLYSHHNYEVIGRRQRVEQKDEG